MTAYKYPLLTATDVNKLTPVDYVDNLSQLTAHGIVDLLYLLRNVQTTDATAADIATAANVLDDIYQQLSDYVRANNL